MARKRFITSEMSTDEKLASIAEINPTAALMWPWFITAFDDWGRMSANPVEVKLTLFPAFPFTSREIAQAIQLYDEYGIAHKYEVDGKPYLAINPNVWFKYQTYITADRKKKQASKYPAPPNPPWEKQIADNQQQSAIVANNQQKSANIADNLQQTQQQPTNIADNLQQTATHDPLFADNLQQLQKIVPSPSLSLSLSSNTNINNIPPAPANTESIDLDNTVLIEETAAGGAGAEKVTEKAKLKQGMQTVSEMLANAGILNPSPFAVKKLYLWLDEQGWDLDMLKVALEEMAMTNTRNLKYVEGVFTRWANEGFKSVADVEADRQRFALIKTPKKTNSKSSQVSQSEPPPKQKTEQDVYNENLMVQMKKIWKEAGVIAADSS
ncbi:DnaD domain-containing protein [Carboxydocella sp. ULO1]|uniref:DnaD domain-containing protein n=1 Tax=Carboxydocella sp. ULO1 TaxID=1926599 RepID=UPI0009AE0B1A|nr:DnaD domain protein [Carboxydocella sp. ULO1]